MINMTKKSILLVFLLPFFSTYVTSQELNPIAETEIQTEVELVAGDIIVTKIIELQESDLEKIPDLRQQFEKQNQRYSTPATPDKKLLRFLKKDELEMAPEALYWARLVRDASTQFDRTMTFRDTIIVNPIFLPPLFRGELLPKDLTLYNPEVLKQTTPYDNLYTSDTLFAELKHKKELEELATKYIEYNYPEYYRYSIASLPKERLKAQEIEKKPWDAELFVVENKADFSNVTTPPRFMTERRYWASEFESAVQVSQNHISENWHAGGSSNLNIFVRNYFKYDYNKNKIQFTNELEQKASIFNAPNDTLHNFKIGDDLFRIHSNFGYKAFSKWYYTFDAEFKTQFFNNYEENTSVKQIAFLAPYSINMGIGIKYNLAKEFAKPYKNVTLSVNLAPFSYSYMYSRDKDIDLGRHGFKQKKGSEEYYNWLSQFGSTIRADLTFNFTRNIAWQLRFYYFTIYDQVQAEFENTLTLAISRFFSTRIYMHVRFDDGVEQKEDHKSYFQVNELISFGFNYKW